MAGADALGLGGELGSLQPGRRAHLVAVALPPGSRDPEEALVGGVSAGSHPGTAARRRGGEGH